ncbi:hypothetical protein M758_10G015600 [Ceratodon purpureus]|uniref:Secreted protein n=1 Tax=Ceratodon purpureus TaxID=3225 RepID=A0A8T0GIA7_CERPU|nr:hypothetical protein KC19_10G016400 [Ceratodon purpureus]KAG0602451.1 hypothetical protein M758_10G015600 [Ceratodon purpureus]
MWLLILYAVVMCVIALGNARCWKSISHRIWHALMDIHVAPWLTRISACIQAYTLRVWDIGAFSSRMALLC